MLFVFLKLDLYVGPMKDASVDRGSVFTHTHTLESHPTPHSKRQVYKRKFCSFIYMKFMLHGSLQDEGPRPRAAVFLYSFGRTDISYLCERAEAMTQ